MANAAEVRGGVTSSLVEQLVAAGAHFGRQRSRRHPSMVEAIATTHEGIDIINLAVTVEDIVRAERVMEQAGARKVMVLWVSERMEGRGSVRDAAEALEHPYVIRRWLGGTLTNIEEMRKRMKRLEALRKASEAGEEGQLRFYTKRERLMLARERARLEESFGPLMPLKDHMPALGVLVDPTYSDVALKEFQALGIPVIGLLSTDGDRSAVPYPIVCNVSSRATVSLVIQRLCDAYLRGKHQGNISQPSQQASSNEDVPSSVA